MSLIRRGRQRVSSLEDKVFIHLEKLDDADVIPGNGGTELSLLRGENFCKIRIVNLQAFPLTEKLSFH